MILVRGGGRSVDRGIVWAQIALDGRGSGGPRRLLPRGWLGRYRGTGKNYIRELAPLFFCKLYVRLIPYLITELRGSCAQKLQSRGYRYSHYVIFLILANSKAKINSFV